MLLSTILTSSSTSRYQSSWVSSFPLTFLFVADILKVLDVTQLLDSTLFHKGIRSWLNVNITFVLIHYLAAPMLIALLYNSTDKHEVEEMVLFGLDLFVGELLLVSGLWVPSLLLTSDFWCFWKRDIMPGFYEGNVVIWGVQGLLYTVLSLGLFFHSLWWKYASLMAVFAFLWWILTFVGLGHLFLSHTDFSCLEKLHQKLLRLRRKAKETDEETGEGIPLNEVAAASAASLDETPDATQSSTSTRQNSSSSIHQRTPVFA